MLNFSTSKYQPNFLPAISLLLLLNACASIQQPGGGPKDTTPPKVLKESPKNLSTLFNSEKVEIQFDEFIKLSNEFSEVSISPALDKMPALKARKQNLEIKFEQPLEKNTTYTLNFGKAIADVNESNVLKNYSYVFSTGHQIDSLSISGTVKSSTTKKAEKDITVFIIPVKQDSIFGKKRANIFTSTDSSGRFELKNLREDNYLIYALKEQSADRIYNSPGEEIAFYKDTIKLSRNISDINLELFTEVPSEFRVKDKKIGKDGRITVVFNKPLKDPGLRILAPKALDATKTIEFNIKKDSALVWLPELNIDSVQMVILDKNTPIDTTTLSLNKKDTYNRSANISTNLYAAKLKPSSVLTLTISQPVKNYDISKITLLSDSVALSGLKVEKDPSSLRRYFIKYPWKVETEYDLSFGEGAFIDATGTKSKAFKTALAIDSEENYGTISIDISVPDTAKSYIVQWLNEQDVILRSDVISKKTLLTYLKYPTGKYRIRVVYDQNKNGEWDTGSLKNRVYPELIWNYDKDLTLRANWDLEEKITIPKAP